MPKKDCKTIKLRTEKTFKRCYPDSVEGDWEEYKEARSTRKKPFCKKNLVGKFDPECLARRRKAVRIQQGTVGKKFLRPGSRSGSLYHEFMAHYMTGKKGRNLMAEANQIWNELKEESRRELMRE